MTEKKKMTMTGFDLGGLEVNSEHRLEIRHPATGEGIDWYVTILGEDSDPYRKIMNLISHGRQKRMRQTGKMLPSYSEIQDGNVEIVCACVTKIEGFIEHGKPVDDNPVERKRVFRDRKNAWLVAQVLAEIENRENFFTG